MVTEEVEGLKELPRLAVISSYPATKIIRTVLARINNLLHMKDALIRFIAGPLLSMNPGKWLRMSINLSMLTKESVSLI